MGKRSDPSPGSLPLGGGERLRSWFICAESLGQVRMANRWVGKRYQCPAVEAVHKYAAGHKLVPCSHHYICVHAGHAHSGRGHSHVLCVRNGRYHNFAYFVHDRGPVPHP
jgi:hypothetical protein